MSEICANCGAQLKSGMLSANCLLEDRYIELINLTDGTQLVTGCQKCSEDTYHKARNKLSGLIQSKRKSAENLLARLPLASVHVPLDWSFATLGLVTAQTVTGTGLFSDVTSAFTDLFGTQSGTYNQKLRAAENMCRMSLQAQTFQMGGNAIVGVDVDYAEVGGPRAMLMVCMTGTAVSVQNELALGEGFSDSFKSLKTESAALRSLTDTAREHGVFTD